MIQREFIENGTIVLNTHTGDISVSEILAEIAFFNSDPDLPDSLLVFVDTLNSHYTFPLCEMIHITDAFAELSDTFKTVKFAILEGEFRHSEHRSLFSKMTNIESVKVQLSTDRKKLMEWLKE